MGGGRDILEIIRTITGGNNRGEFYIFDAEVISVNLEARTCKVKTLQGDTPIEIDPVRIIPQVQDGFIIKPAVGSHIIVIYSNKFVPFILQFSETDGIYVTVGDSTLDITSEKFDFNGGEKNGLPLSQAVTDRLNTLERDLNTLKSVLSGWTPVPSDGGAALKAAAGSWYGQNIQETSVSDIENDKIKQ